MTAEEIGERLRKYEAIVALLKGREATCDEAFPTLGCWCGYCSVARVLGWPEHERKMENGAQTE